jgi:alanyl-tRNA synthetase
VTRTGEIGLLKVLRLDYRGDETRVEFVCGGRALEDYRDKNFIVMELGAALTVGYWELPEAVARLQEGLKEAEKRLRGARKELLAEVGGRLARMASPVGDIQVVSQVLDDQPPGDLRVLAYEVTSHADTLALLASLHEGRVHVCFARSDGVDRDAAALLHTALDELDGKGGGNPTIAQGSAPLVDRERVEAVLNALVDTLYEQ